MRDIYLLDLPETDYMAVLGMQRAAVEARRAGTLDRDLVILLEHSPVFTLGRRGGRENLLVPEIELQQRNIDIVPIERGGNITYHGPGQLVAYLIFDLRAAKLSVTDLVTGLETVMVNVAAHYHVRASGNTSFRGAWVQQRKLGSIGVTIRHGISFHGLAFNANTDLEPFGWINPCGIHGCTMTSLARETGQPVEMPMVRRQMAAHLSDIFNVRPGAIGLPELDSKIFGSDERTGLESQSYGARI
jgi:lipoate-protein ligase B